MHSQRVLPLRSILRRPHSGAALIEVEKRCMHPVNKARNKAEERAIERVRRICLALPWATEKLACGFKRSQLFPRSVRQEPGKRRRKMIWLSDLGGGATEACPKPEQLEVARFG